MTKPKFYQSISVEKELPKEGGAFICELVKKQDGITSIRNNLCYYYKASNDWAGIESGYKIVSYLQEFSLPELMEELLDWTDKNYVKLDQNIYILKFSNESFLNKKRFTYKELTEIFLKTKEIL